LIEHYPDDEELEHETNVVYIRFKSGKTMMGMVDLEEDESLTISGAMDVEVVDAGMSIQPTIPYGIDQPIKLSKHDMLFSIEPNEILISLYLDRSSEAANILMNYLQRIEEQKKKKVKSLN
jgi:hypothetical protein